MRLLAAATASLMITWTHAMASAGGTEVEGMGIAGILFVAFIVMVILFQLLPGMTLFLDIVKGLFSSKAEEHTQEGVKNNKTTL